MSHAFAHSPSGPSSGLGRHAYWGGLAAVFALALWARLSVWRQVFVAGEVLTQDPDADYHLLRIARTLDQFPRVPVFDAQLNWPEGGLCPWAPGFDALGALFAWLLGAGPGSAEIERAVAFYPVLLGLATLAATIALVRQLLPAGKERDVAALAAGSLVAVLPRAVSASSLGRVDHHVFEALVYVLLCSWALRAVRAASARSALPWGFELHGAAVITLAGSGFTGSILYAGLAAGIVGATRLSAPSGPTPWIGSGAPAFGISALALWLLYAPSIAQHGQAFDFRLASQLQPALHALLAFGCGVVTLQSRIGAPEASLRARIRSRGLWLAGGAVVAGVASWPWLGDGVSRDAYAWITTQDPWLASIVEFQPLWRSGEWRSLLDFNGWPGLLTPLVIPVAWVVIARHDRASAWAFGFWLIALLPLAWLRSRFATPATQGFAICAALSLLALTRVLARRSWPPPKPAFASALLALAILAADPATRAMLQLRPARGPNAIESVTLTLGALPEPGPPRGALVQWSYGHTVLRHGGRPVLSAGFGHWTGAEAFQASETFMQRDIPQLMQLMEERRLGYVITGMNAPFPAPGDRVGDPRKPFVVHDHQVIWNAPYFRARPLAPLLVGGSGDPELDIPHIPTLMPQYASAQSAPGMGFPLQRLWLYEKVEGARLLGRAAAFAQVVAETPLAIWGQPTTYRAWTQADAAGRYELILPLPTGRRSEALATGPRVTLSSMGSPLAVLSVSESDVRLGRRIAVDPNATVQADRQDRQHARNP